MTNYKHDQKPFVRWLKKGIIGIILACVMFISQGTLVGCFGGLKGKDGADGTVWKSGLSYLEFDNAKEGDYFIDTDDYQLWQKTEDDWVLVMENYGRASVLQNEIELQVAFGQIQWRYKTGEDTEWKNLIDVSTLQGESGKEIKLQITTDYIQWQYEGDIEWYNLIALSALKGSDGRNNVVSSGNFMHVSFDDVEKCFVNLSGKNYTSLYDEPFFKWLKQLHDSYGAKFSLYAYNNVLASVPNKYATEFFQAKDWLKIGLHAVNASSTFSSSTYEQGKSAWNTFINNVVRITGSYLSVDRMPRLHTFAGSEDALKGMRDASYGALGFLSADDSRTSYYFSKEITTYLYSNDHITDHKNGLVFLATDMRADWFNNGFSSSNTYRKPTKNNVYDELVLRYTDVNYANATSSFIFFGHEWDVYNGASLVSSVSGRYEDVFKFSCDYDIRFDYPQNNSFYPTPYDIFPLGSNENTSPDSGDVKEDTATFGTEGVSLVIENSIRDLTFVVGKTVGGKATAFLDVKGRATSITQVLAVNGGEVVKLTQGIEGVSLSYSLTESTSKNIVSSSIPTGGCAAETWLTGSTTLRNETKYLIIAFKKGDGTEDFTLEELEQLKNCITINSAIETEQTITNFNGFDLEIVEDFSKVEYVAGVSIGGEKLNYTSTAGRAVSQTQILKVSSSNLILSLDQTKTSVALQYTVYEFKALPLNGENFLNKTTAGTWINSDYQLNSSTKYVMILFRNATDTNADFLKEDLALLNTCITFRKG